MNQPPDNQPPLIEDCIILAMRALNGNDSYRQIATAKMIGDITGVDMFRVHSVLCGLAARGVHRVKPKLARLSHAYHVKLDFFYLAPAAP